MNQEEIVTRLRRVEGQVRGLQRMVSEQKDCEAIITQLMAARAALDKVGVSIVTNYLGQCLASPDPQQRVERMLNLIFSRYADSLPGEEKIITSETD
ncbi:MAG: metal-sensitive transcriptional regulator [Anaerolineae bacterium]|jgi:DNA-binding FrmR family transcriptional regulator|nr:metal-sensitive transcriptional regulator [Anaerolineae bacterium]MDH7474120.1 metal-sensitive transcriptional regulator [Anaerolineae bacterium]